MSEIRLVGLNVLSDEDLRSLLRNYGGGEVFRGADGLWHFRNADSVVFSSEDEEIPGRASEREALLFWVQSCLEVGE